MFFQKSSTLLLQCLIISFAILHTSATPVKRDIPDALKPRQSEATPHPLDYAPDFSADPFPPWPDVYNADGSNISTQNWRGTKLFGWKGCDIGDKNLITSTMKDFYTLAQQDAVNNIDWSSQAVAEIWGHGEGSKVLLDNIKPQIQQIFQAAQQIYDKNWWVPPYIYDPPWVAWRNLWIRVQCSPDGDEDNVCGDKPQSPDPNCPDGTPPSPGTSTGVEAFSDPLGRYSKITFCNIFFNKMTDLQSVINTAKKNARPYQNDLWNYQNRARCLFHEMTHLNYFMNAPDKSPYVEEARLQWGSGKGRKNQLAYGPENIKILANYEAVGKGGFYTQRNADSYAWFAVAKYIESQVGLYPTDPVQNEVPVRAPTRKNGKPFATTSDPPLDNSGDWNTTQDPSHYIPGCSDFKSTDSATFGASTVNNNAVTSCPDTNALSGVPYNVFSGGNLNPNIFDTFCEDIDGTVNSNGVFDSSGNPVTSSSRKHKRTPPPNASTYKTFNFKLSWTNEGAENDGCGQTVESCREAFAKLANSPCGHQGGEQETLTVAGSISLPGCGTYSYLISGPDVPGSGETTSATKATAPPTTATSSAPAVNTTSADCIACGDDLGASNCAASDSACLVNQCKNDMHCQACGIDCNQYAST